MGIFGKNKSVYSNRNGQYESYLEEPVHQEQTENSLQHPTNPKRTVSDTSSKPNSNIRLSPQNQNYGIDDAIKLMKNLPNGGDEKLVVNVVLATLHSANVDVSFIIDDADQKISHLKNRGHVLESKIAELKAEIRSHEKEIDQLERNLAETSHVRQKLKPTEAKIQNQTELKPPLPQNQPKQSKVKSEPPAKDKIIVTDPFQVKKKPRARKAS